jgi:hypothetical protein
MRCGLQVEWCGADCKKQAGRLFKFAGAGDGLLKSKNKEKAVVSNLQRWLGLASLLRRELHGEFLMTLGQCMNRSSMQVMLAH